MSDCTHNTSTVIGHNYEFSRIKQIFINKWADLSLTKYYRMQVK